MSQVARSLQSCIYIFLQAYVYNPAQSGRCYALGYATSLPPRTSAPRGPAPAVQQSCLPTTRQLQAAYGVKGRSALRMRYAPDSLRFREQCPGGWLFFGFVVMRSVPFEFVSGLATEFGAVECCWRESERSFTGYVAEVWFGFLPTFFAQRWAVVVGYSVLVRSVSSGPGRFMVSVPVTVPQGAIRLSGGQRGGRVRVVVHPPSAY